MGMESVFKLSVVMGMIDNLSGGLSKVESNATSSVSRMNSAFGTMQKAGAAMSGVGVAILGVAAKTVTATFATQDALGELASLGVSDLAAVEKAAKSFSDTWAGTSKADFISASYDIKSGIASLTDEGVAQFTELAALTAKATKATAGDMTSLFATGYGIYKGYYSDLSDLEFGEMFSAGISTAVKNYKTAGTEMAGAISTLGATATNANVPMEEQLAIVGQLQATMSGSEAGTKYKAFLNAASSAGEKLGLTFLDTNNQLMSMPDILTTLRGKYGDTIDAVEKQQLKEAFGTDEAIAVIDLLYNNVDTLSTGIDDLKTSMDGGTESTKKMAEAINNTPAQKLEVLKQQIHNNTEALGNALLPAVNNTLDKVNSFIQKGSEWITNNQETVNSIVKIVTIIGILLVVLGVVTMAVGTFGKMFLAAKNAIMIAKTSMTLLSGVMTASPIMLVVLAIAALVAVFSVLWNKSEGFRDFWSNITQMMGQAVQKGLEFVKNLLSTLAAELPSIVSTGTSIITSLITGITEALPGIIQTGTQILLKLLNAQIQAMPKFIQAGIKIINSLLQGITSALPTIIQAGIDLLTQLLQAIIEALPLIMDAGVTLITGLIQGITSALPMIIQAGIQLLTDLLNTIMAALPMLIQAGVSMINTLIQGIVTALPMIIQAGIQLILLLLQGIIANIPTIIQGGVQVLLSLIQGIITTIPTLISAIPQIFGTFIDGILSVDWLSVGLDLIIAILKGVLDGACSLVGGIVDAIVDLFSDGGESKEVGTNMGTDMAAGITSASSEVESAANATSNKALKGFDIDKIMASSYGSDASGAFGTGILNGSQAATSAATTTSAATVQALSINEVAAKTLGSDLTSAYSGGITQGSPLAVSASNTMSAEALHALDIDETAAGMMGLDLTNAFGNGVANGTETAASAAQAASSTVSQSFAAVGTEANVNWQQASTEVQNASTQIQTACEIIVSNSEKVTSAWKAAGTQLTSIWQNLPGVFRNAWSAVHSTALSGTSSTINAIVSAFANMRITIPRPSLPRVNVSYSTVGSGEAKASVPNFSVSYYAKGGIMTRPTAFGIEPGTGNTMVGGEAGAEAILPLDLLWKKLQEVITGLFPGNEDDPDGKNKSIVSGIIKKETQSLRREEKTSYSRNENYKTSGKGQKTIRINRLNITVDISRLQNLQMLQELIDELTDAQNGFDDEDYAYE